MSRYIDADKIIYLHFAYAGNETKLATKIDIDKIPTADVQEVKHGHWTDTYIEDNIEYGYCSLCSAYVMVDNYCSYCGAKMDEEADDDR